MVLEEKILLGKKTILGGGKSYWIKTLSSTGFVVESFEVAMYGKLLLGEKQSIGEENPVG